MSLVGLRMGLCTPQASATEAAAGWLRPVDLQRIVVGALEADVKFGVYHAVSWPSRRRWNIDTTIKDLGYQPERGNEEPHDAPESADAALATCPGRGQVRT